MISLTSQQFYTISCVVFKTCSSDDAAGVLLLPLRMHSLSCSIIISCFHLLFPHHIYLWSFLCLCDAEPLGRGFLWVLVYPTSWPAAPQSQLSLFVMLPQKCSENQNSSMEIPQRPRWVTRFSCLLISAFYAFFDINQHLDFCFSDSRMKH